MLDVRHRFCPVWFRASLPMVLVSLLLAAPAPAGAEELPEPEEVVAPTPFLSLSGLHPGGRIWLAVAGDVLEGWHVNAHVPSDDYLIPTELGVEAAPGLKVGPAVYPDGEMVAFEFAEEPLRVYEGRFFIVVPVDAEPDADTGSRRLKVVLSYQACSDRICLAPTEVPFEVDIPVVPVQQAVSPDWPEIFQPLEDRMAPASPVRSQGAEGEDAVSGASPLVFLAIFLGGLALNLTPCVYPIIPITVGFFGGQVERSTLGTFFLAVLYVLGMATTYSTMGVVVALTGGLFGAALQSPLVLGFVALVLVVLALSQFGVYEFRIPGTSGLGARQGMAGAYVMGLVVGLVAAPCIGPFVLGLLLTVAQEGNAVLGFWKFFVLSLGLGTPYLFLGVFSAGMSMLPRAGEWMEGVKHLFGHALLATAAYFLGQAVPEPVGPLLLPAALVISGLWLLFLERSGRTAWFTAARAAAGVLALTLAAWWVWPDTAERIPFREYSTAAVEEAIDSGKPVLIDFTADWCVPCKEYEHNVFNDAAVVETAREFVNLQADLTRTSSAEVQALLEEFAIVGPPTIVFLDSSGREHEDLRIVGYIGPESFLKRMQAAVRAEQPRSATSSVSF